MLLHQVFSFNSPVWFNVGTTSPAAGLAPASSSRSTTRWTSILNWYREEGLIFKGGSGAGLNLSRIRSSKELLSSGGTASGPVSFMRGADASRRHHQVRRRHPPGGEDGRARRRPPRHRGVRRDQGQGGGQDPGAARRRVRHGPRRRRTSSRCSTRTRTTRSGSPTSSCARSRPAREFGLRARQTGEVIETVDAEELFRKIAQAAWECADPGIQYDDTINDWHTSPESGRITASNPCSEYMHLDNSSLQPGVAEPDEVPAPTTARSTRPRSPRPSSSSSPRWTSRSASPTSRPQPIAETTRAFRQLGIGYANLGALLMATGHAYDSEGGRVAGRGDHLADDRRRPTSGRPSWPASSARTTATPATPTRTSGSCASTPPPTTTSARSAANDAATLKLATTVWAETHRRSASSNG